MSILSLADAELYFEAGGDGEPLLLLPGLGMDHSYFRLVAPVLERDFTVIAVDPRGVGRSTRSAPPYTIERWALDFASLIEGLGRGPMHVLGSSLGAATALALAERRPELVRCLVVVGAFSELDRMTRLHFDLRARLIEKLGLSDEVADYMSLGTLSREFLESAQGAAQIQANRARIGANSPELYLAFVKAILHWGRCLPGQESAPKFTTRLGNIRAPTLVIAADNDQLLPLASSRMVADGIPGAHLFVMKGGGHIPFIEHPLETAAIVADFIRRARSHVAAPAG